MITVQQTFLAHDGLLVKRFPFALRQQARIAAAMEGLPLNRWIVRAVERAIQQEKIKRRTKKHH